MLHQHGFCEFVIIVFQWFCKDSGEIGRGPGEVKANPKTDVNMPWARVGEVFLSRDYIKTIESLPRIPPGPVVRYSLLLKCHSMMQICFPSLIWSNVEEIFEMYREDLGTTWVYVGVMLSHARVILV